MSIVLFAALQETDRGRWLQSIQLAIDGLEFAAATEQYEIDERIRQDEAFDQLNMITFDDKDPHVIDTPETEII